MYWQQLQETTMQHTMLPWYIYIPTKKLWATYFFCAKLYIGLMFFGSA